MTFPAWLCFFLCQKGAHLQSPSLCGLVREREVERGRRGREGGKFSGSPSSRGAVESTSFNFEQFSQSFKIGLLQNPHISIWFTWLAECACAACVLVLLVVLPCSPVPLSHILHQVFVVAPMQCLAGVLSRVSFNLIRGSFTELTMNTNQVACDYILWSIRVQVCLQFYIQVWLEFLTHSFGTVGVSLNAQVCCGLFLFHPISSVDQNSN